MEHNQPSRPVCVEPVRELTPQSDGIWLVRSRTSSHRWDLDAGTYTRVAGRTGSPMPYDGVALRIASVVRWPSVGAQSHVVCDHPEDPFQELFRVSATITCIERAR